MRVPKRRVLLPREWAWLGMILVLTMVSLSVPLVATGPTELRLTVDPNLGPPGIAVQVRGRGFDGDCGVDLFFDTTEGPSLGFASVRKRGTFTADIIIFQDALPGTHKVVGQGRQFEEDGSCGDPSGNEVSEVFTVIDAEVTQIFSDLKLTPPQADEITAPPIDQDTSFPPAGPAVEPSPPMVELPPELTAQHSTESDAPLEDVTTTEVLQSEEGLWVLAGTTGTGNPKPISLKYGNTAIHAALMRRTATSTKADSGADILFFAGDAHDPVENKAESFRHTGVFKIFQPMENNFLVERIDSPPADLFCSGHAQLEDGRLLVAGGTDKFPENYDNTLNGHKALGHFTAVRDSFIFDPKQTRWSESFQMNFQPGPKLEPGTKGGGRWYPSLLTLNSGQVLAFRGHPALADTRHDNNTPEYFDPTTLIWKFLGIENDSPLTDNQGRPQPFYYPRVHLLPNGRVFRATPLKDPANPSITRNVVINPIRESLANPNDEISVRISNGPEEYDTALSYPSVLLPLTPATKYRARILLAGRRKSEYMNLTTNNIKVPPQCGDKSGNWCETAPRTTDKIRYHANATILPTGEVFVSGGEEKINVPQTAVQEGEIYNPFEDTWRTVKASTVPREYHSVAVLMPDGRVWHGGTSVGGAKGAPNQEYRIDLYEPWYYTKTRPVILTLMKGPLDPVYPGARMMHLHDSSVEVIIDHYRDTITRFALVRAGSATHAFNFDQRYVELQSELLDMGPINFPVSPGFRFKFRLTSPPSSSIAPPGNYLLFAIDDLGVPSVGRFIRIDRKFVGELKQEAEDITSFTRLTPGLFVPGCTSPDPIPFLQSEFAKYAPNQVIEYGGVDFGTEKGVVKNFSARVCTGKAGGTISVRLDRPDSEEIATLLTLTGKNEFVTSTSAVTSSVEGVHNVFVTIGPHPSSKAVFVDWFKFHE